MSPPEHTSLSFCKESNKLVGTTNFLAWKKRIDLLLKENELLDLIKGNTTIPVKEQTQALAKYNKAETRAQRILIESIKDSLIPYVSKFETSKEIYDKLIELLSVSTVGEVISLRNDLYKMKISKEGIVANFMKIFEMRDQLQELGEVMSDREKAIVVLNALPEDWGNFTSSIYAKKEATPLSELWSLFKIEETGLKGKDDVGSKKQAFATMAKRKGKFGKFGPRGTSNRDMSKVQCFGCQEYAHYKRDCPKLEKDNNNKRKMDEAHLTQEVKEEDKKQKKEDPPNLYYN